MKLLILLLITVFLSGCATTKTNFEPQIGGACLSPESLLEWAETTPGDQKASKNPINNVLGLGVGIATVIPMYFVDMGNVTKHVSRKIIGSMPQCGNWCGAGYPKPTENPPAIDLLDEACRAHDLCYREKGNFDCSCDQNLVYAVLRGRHIMDVSPIERKIAIYFRASHCENGCKQIAGTKNCSDRYQR